MFRSGFLFLFALFVFPSLVLSQQECVYSTGSSREFSALKFEGDCTTADAAVFKKSTYIVVDTAYMVPATIRVEEKAKVTLDGKYGSSFSNPDGLLVENYGELTVKNFVNHSTGGFFVHHNMGDTYVSESSYLWLVGSRARLNNSGEFENKGFTALMGHGYTHFLNNQEATFKNDDTFIVHGGSAVVFRNDGKIWNSGSIYLDSDTRGSFLNFGEIRNLGHLSIGHHFVTVRAGDVYLAQKESVLHVYNPEFLSFETLSGRGLVSVGTYANDTRTSFKLKATKIVPDTANHIEFNFPNNDLIHLEGTLHVKAVVKADMLAHVRFHQGVDVSQVTLEVDGDSLSKGKMYPIFEAEFIQGTLAALTSANGEPLSEDFEVTYDTQRIYLSIPKQE